ncbi:MAG TPA: hypothetical protein GXZ89_07735, partial [Fastidiosipila sp.]|nr:hypothetical protein [Fastidiosipila sp.]
MVATILTFLVSFLILLQTTLFPIPTIEQPNEPTPAAIEVNLNQPMTDDPLERYLLQGLLKGITRFDIEELKNDVNLPDLTVIELVGKATQLVLQHPQIGSLYDVFVGPENTTLEFNEIVTYGEALERRQALEEVITELLRGYDW